LVVNELKEGALDKAGVKKDFIITRIQGKKIASVEDIKQILSDVGEGAVIEVEGTYVGSRYMYVYKVKLE